MLGDFNVAIRLICILSFFYNLFNISVVNCANFIYNLRKKTIEKSVHFCPLNKKRACSKYVSLQFRSTCPEYLCWYLCSFVRVSQVHRPPAYESRNSVIRHSFAKLAMLHFVVEHDKITLKRNTFNAHRKKN